MQVLSRIHQSLVPSDCLQDTCLLTHACWQLRLPTIEILGRCHAGIVVEDVFNAFAVAAFFEFVVFAIFEMRYLLLVWRARRANSLDAWAAQRELSVLYARFYGVLLAGVFLGYQLHLCAHLTTPVLAVLRVCHVWVSEQNQEPRSAVLIDRCASSTVPLKLGIHFGKKLDLLGLEDQQKTPRAMLTHTSPVTRPRWYGASRMHTMVLYQ